MADNAPQANENIEDETMEELSDEELGDVAGGKVSGTGTVYTGEPMPKRKNKLSKVPYGATDHPASGIKKE